MNRHAERLRRHYRGFQALRLELRVFAAIGIAVFAYLLVYFISTPERSYAIVAASKGVEIEFRKGGLSDWRLADAVLCRPLPRREKRTAEASNGEALPPSGCDEARYAVVPVSAAEIIWPDKTAISVTRGGDRFVRIAVRRTERSISVSKDQSISTDDFVVVPEQSFDRSGVLPYFGCIRVGLELRAGANTELVSGRYETREKLFPRRDTRLVETGEFLPGDSLSFRRSPSEDAECLPVGGFLGSTDDNDVAGMRVVAYAKLGKPTLMVDRRGLEPIPLVPDWMDRAFQDPWLLGIAAILGFLATIKTLCIDSLSLLDRASKPVPEAVSVAPSPATATVAAASGPGVETGPRGTAHAAPAGSRVPSATA